MTQIKNLFSFVSTLSGVQRFSLLKLVHKENVLEHTGMVAIFALTITKQVNKNLPEEKQISIASVLQKAIVHDWDEVVTGDVVRPTKYFSANMRQEFKCLEKDGIARIAEDLDTPWLPNMHAHSKDNLEGYIVAFADLMAAVHRVWEEVLVFHNHHMVPPAQGMRKFLFSLYDKRPIEFSNLPALAEYYDAMNGILKKVCSINSEYTEPTNAY